MIPGIGESRVAFPRFIVNRLIVNRLIAFIPRISEFTLSTRVIRGIRRLWEEDLNV